VGAAGAASSPGAGGTSTEDGGASNGGSNESGAGGGGSGGASGGTPEPEKPPKLLLTQYFEGTGSDKALELTNVGSDPAKLSLCELSLYTNGGVTPYRTSPLSGVLEPGASIVYCSTALSEGLAGRCAGSLSALVYNGDDALVLRCLDEASDRLGRVGEDPGEAWGAAPSTKNANLTRRCSVSTGDVAFDEPFELAVAWSALPLTELGDLGLWTCLDPGAGGAGGFSLTSPE
jgi:predicted extracellular nuclease